MNIQKYQISNIKQKRKQMYTEAKPSFVSRSSQKQKKTTKNRFFCQKSQKLQNRTNYSCKTLPAPIETLQRAFKMLNRNRTFLRTYAEK